MAKPTPLTRVRAIVAGIVPRLVLRLGLSGLAAWLCARDVRMHKADGKTAMPFSSDRSKIVVLVLTPFKFRGDLDALAAQPDICLLEMPHLWQIWMLFNFYRNGIKSNLIFTPGENAAVANEQRQYRAFLSEFLARLYERLGVACVIGADVRYREDIDIGVVSKQLGVPYLVFHRENMLASKTLYEAVRFRHSQWGRFGGTAVIVHNEVTNKNFVESGFVEPERIEILGSARMDTFLARIRTPRPTGAPTGPVVFFSFSHEQFDYPQPVFDQAHVAVATVALRNRNVDVIVKPKIEIVNKTPWVAFYNNALKAAGIDPEAIPNLKVLPRANAQELILKASVVCAINSTTLLEAGVAGVPVIVPCFKEIQGREFSDRVNFRDDLDMFDIPADADEMIALIERYIKDATVDGELVRRRRALFERYVSSFIGGAADRYRATIVKHVRAAGAPFAPLCLVAAKDTQGASESLAAASR